MYKASDELDFEKALEYRNIISGIENLQTDQRNNTGEI